jgi:hypothetical protein
LEVFVDSRFTSFRLCRLAFVLGFVLERLLEWAMMSGWFEGFAFVQELGLGLSICFKDRLNKRSSFGEECWGS